MTNDKLAEQLAGSVAQEGANFSRRIREDRKVAPQIISARTELDDRDADTAARGTVTATADKENNADNDPGTLTLSANALRMAAQIDAYIIARDNAEEARNEAQRRLHEANARIEQKESTINSLTSDAISLRSQLEQERNKSMRLFAAVRTMRSASDEIVRMEEEAERAGQ